MALLLWFLLIEQEANLQLIIVGQCLAKCKEHVNK